MRTIVFLNVCLIVNHLPYWLHMSIAFQGLNQTFYPCLGYAVFCQPFTRNKRVERRWSNVSTTVTTQMSKQQIPCESLIQVLYDLLWMSAPRLTKALPVTCCSQSLWRGHKLLHSLHHCQPSCHDITLQLVSHTLSSTVFYICRKMYSWGRNIHLERTWYSGQIFFDFISSILYL